MIQRTINGNEIAVSSGDMVLRLPRTETIEPDKQYDVIVKEHRNKRSNDANAYMWVLIGEISKSLHSTPAEIYRNYIEDYGLYRDFTLTESETKTFCHVWQRQGLGWPTTTLDYSPDGDKIVTRAYYGSSCYDTKQMTRLIDAIVTDCREMGIETKPQEEINSLLAQWEAKS